MPSAKPCVTAEITAEESDMDARQPEDIHIHVEPTVIRVPAERSNSNLDADKPEAQPKEIAAKVMPASSPCSPAAGEISEAAPLSNQAVNNAGSKQTVSSLGSEWGADAHKFDTKLAGILPAFYAMERRRRRRALNGRARRSGFVSHTSHVFNLMLVAMLFVHFFEVDFALVREYRFIPGIATAVVASAAFVTTLRTPEHVTTEWLRAETNLLVLWLAWEFDYDQHQEESCWWSDLCFLESEISVLITFAVVFGFTLIWALFSKVLIPFAVEKAFWHTGAFFWWRIRRVGNETNGTSGMVDQSRVPTFFLSAEHSLPYEAVVCTYLPGGWFSAVRAKFGYIGERDELGRPHGFGMWFDSSFHGECLRGYWEEGIPKGSFTSREFGTGAQFAQSTVAYVTSRADCPPSNLTAAWKMPRKLDKLRYGIAKVEASFAGGFFPFLPSVEHHMELKSVEEMKKLVEAPAHRGRDLRAAKMTATKSNEKPMLNVTVMSDEDLEDLENEDGQDLLQTVDIPIRFRDGDRMALVALGKLGGARGLLEQKPEALVFLHGYNSDVATSCGRMAQLLTLGNMASHIVPFVFSYSAGFALSYLQVKQHMPEYKRDLKEFFTELGKQYKEIHIICHSCGAEFFFLNYEAIISCFAPKRTTSIHDFDTSIGHDRLPQLTTLTLINPDVLVDTVCERLPKIMDVAEHFTTYNDKKDGALFWSGFIQTVVPKRFRRGTIQPLKGRRAIIFGAVVSPLWLEPAANKEDVALKGPVVDLPGNLSWFGAGTTGRPFSDAPRLDKDIDVIDCSSIDQNIHKLRHNYYMLNTQVVEDICELIGSRRWANNRTRLVRTEANTFNFLCPPADVLEL